ncbi:hypothetical protein QUF63_07585 [Anaerolineales bacterium HSG25]|nr:hypothetical protein [Anaerolineales bacterium HSG25]
MLVTLELPIELERELKTQAESEQVSVSKLVEKLLFQILHPEYPELTIEEVKEQYPDEWVAIEITEFDQQNKPQKGIVIAHSVHRDDIVEPTRELYQQKPDVKTYTFFAGPPIPEGVVFIL